MDSNSRSRYTALLKEDWIKLGYLREDDPGLTKKLHPLFQHTNASRPRGAEHIWPQYKSEVEYDAMCAEMGTIFQMASNMLETSKSLDFLYQVANSPRKTSNTGSSNQGRPCKEFGWTEPPSKAMGRQMARVALRRLSRSLTFQIGDPEVNPAVQGSFGSTEATLEHFPEGVKMNDVSSKSGIASKITLNEDYILRLRELDAREGDTTSQRISLQLKMAITLCHEIAVSTTPNPSKPTSCSTRVPINAAGYYSISSDIRMLNLKYLACSCICGRRRNTRDIHPRVRCLHKSFNGGQRVPEAIDWYGRAILQK